MSRLGINTEQVYEIFAVANIVGGTIVIPDTRRAAEYWEELQTEEQGARKTEWRIVVEIWIDLRYLRSKWIVSLI